MTVSGIAPQEIAREQLEARPQRTAGKAGADTRRDFEAKRRGRSTGPDSRAGEARAEAAPAARLRRASQVATDFAATRAPQPDRHPAARPHERARGDQSNRTPPVAARPKVGL